MKKMINDPYQVVEETLSGILKAIAEHLEVDKQELLDTILSD